MPICENPSFFPEMLIVSNLRGEVGNEVDTCHKKSDTEPKYSYTHQCGSSWVFRSLEISSENSHKSWKDKYRERKIKLLQHLHHYDENSDQTSYNRIDIREFLR